MFNNTALRPRRPQRPRNYLLEQIESMDWSQLADRSAPLPAQVDLLQLLKAFEQMYALQISDAGGFDR